MSANRTLDPYQQLQPLQVGFLRFYGAICLELMAHSHHPLSAIKLSLLISAKDSYHRAASSLPRTLYRVNSLSPSTLSFQTNTSDFSTRSNSSDSVLQISSHPSLASLEHGNDDDNNKNDNDDNNEDTLTPQPLNVQKIPECVISPPQADASTASSSSVEREEEGEVRSPSPSEFSDLIKLSPSLDIWLLQRARARHNHLLAEMAGIMTWHATSVDDAIRQTRFEQAGSHMRFVDPRHRGTEDVCPPDRQQRIEMLRGCGWRRERFCPKRYEDLAARILAELGDA